MNLLSIRPLYHEGESLSIYLLRVAESNYINYSDFIRSSKRAEYYQVGSFNHWIIDLYPKLMIDFSVLTKFIDIAENQLESSMLYSVYNKIVDEKDMRNVADFNLKIKDYYDTRCRRYCPLCLKENKHYMMVWQLKDLSFCQKHKTDIISECPHCGAKQPFLSESLLRYECQLCQRSLIAQYIDFGSAKLKNPSEDMVIDTWYFLLEPKKIITEKINGFSLEASIAIKFLYLIQIKHGESFKQLAKRYGKNFIYRLLRIAKENNKLGRLTIPFIFQIIEKTDITLDNLQSVEVDEDFLLKYTKKV